MSAPGYWVNETSGKLAPVVKRFLDGFPLDPLEIGVMRAYCRQWVASPAWDANPYGNEGVKRLRATVDGITSMKALAEWLNDAVEQGMDPL